MIQSIKLLKIKYDVILGRSLSDWFFYKGRLVFILYAKIPLSKIYVLVKENMNTDWLINRLLFHLLQTRYPMSCIRTAIRDVTV